MDGCLLCIQDLQSWKRIKTYAIYADEVVASNIKAKTLYASFKFEDTGIIQGKSMLAIKKLVEK
ncbi:hypothetical protein [Rummeliibacillus stabekisii]|uniref:hypothetical protein n=1 Tax=Rummeliibacillus stabekisii TaxID=241244 RepID=UPI0020410363|nr:hypothetical protein [Rummeliibacillus stabekisii]